MTTPAGDFLCGCDSAVGGISPQIRGESLVSAETEGELQRERDLGCSSENGVSIFLLLLLFVVISLLSRRNASRRGGCFRGLRCRGKP